MANLTENRDRTANRDLKRERPLNINASTTLYRGGISYIDAVTGGLTDTGNAGANKFAGINIDYYANSAGAITTKSPAIVEGGFVERIPLASVTQADIGKIVYGVTTNPADLNFTSTNRVRVGIIWNYVSATEADILWDQAGSA